MKKKHLFILPFLTRTLTPLFESYDFTKQTLQQQS